MGTKFSKTKRKSHPKPVRLTDRDQLVFEALHEYTILTTDQMHSLAGGGRDGFRKRLRLLYDAGYVARPPVQNELFRYGDERPTIYTLGKEGAEYLRLVCQRDVPATIDWERRARDRKGLRGQFKIIHDLGANEVMIALSSALRSLPNIDILSKNQVLEQSPEWTQSAKAPFSIPTRFKWSNGNLYKRTVIPDGVVGYTDHRLDGSMTALLFIEFDQEMDVKRSDPLQSSIKQKIASYSAMFEEKKVKERFGIEHFRVLFVTTGSPKHLKTMVECCQEYRAEVAKVPPYPFFFTSYDEFKCASNPLIDVWRDGAGEQKNITRLR